MRLSRCASLGRRYFSNAAPEAEPSLLDKVFSRSSMPRVPMNVAVPHVIRPEALKSQPLQTTKLENGLRVVSRDGAHPMVNIAVAVDSGSRYDKPSHAGLSNVLEYLAFGSTPTRPDYQLIRDMLQAGVNLTCVTSREQTLYMADCLHDSVPKAVQALADVTQNLSFDAWELAELGPKYRRVLEEKISKPEIQLSEAIYAAAYHNNTLGLPLYPSNRTLEGLNSQILQEQFKALFVPQRIVIAGVGIEHARLVELARENFKASGPSPKVEKANYTGGEVRVANDNPLVHVAIAFETASWNSKDFVPMCALHLLMGGGGSFSAGGPGKGMWSRLYVNVLNNHSWVESATCFNGMFSDSGLLGIQGSCAPEHAEHFVSIASKELVGMKTIEQEELGKAKTQLKAAVLMGLETRAGQSEDLARQFLSYNKIQSAGDLVAQIEAVSVADVQRVAESLLKTRPAVAYVGDTYKAPRYEEVTKFFG